MKQRNQISESEKHFHINELSIYVTLKNRTVNEKSFTMTEALNKIKQSIKNK